MNPRFPWERWSREHSPRGRVLGHRELLRAQRPLGRCCGAAAAQPLLPGPPRGRVHLCLRHQQGVQGRHPGPQQLPGTVHHEATLQRPRLTHVNEQRFGLNWIYFGLQSHNNKNNLKIPAVRRRCRLKLQCIMPTLFKNTYLNAKISANTCTRSFYANDFPFSYLLSELFKKRNFNLLSVVHVWSSSLQLFHKFTPFCSEEWGPVLVITALEYNGVTNGITFFSNE